MIVSSNDLIHSAEDADQLRCGGGDGRLPPGERVHRRHHDMVFFVQPLIERFDFRRQLVRQLIDRVVQTLHVGAVPCRTVLIPDQHEFLKLV